MQAAGIHPAAITYVVTRERAPVYHSFGEPMDEAEVDQLTATVVDVLVAGRWMEPNPEVRRDVVRKIINGQEKAPMQFWRILARGIVALRAKD